MALASAGTRIVPESSKKLVGGLNLTITSSDCEEGSHEAWFLGSKARHPKTLGELFSSTKEIGLHNSYLKNDSFSSSTSSHKGKLRTLLSRSNDSLSIRETSSIWDTSSSSSSPPPSIASPSAAFMHTLLREVIALDGARPSRKAKKQWKLHKETDRKQESFVSLLLFPLKKLKNSYMNCIMGLDGVGDLSGLVQGSAFATSSKYFA